MYALAQKLVPHLLATPPLVTVVGLFSAPLIARRFQPLAGLPQVVARDEVRRSARYALRELANPSCLSCPSLSGARRELAACYNLSATTAATISAVLISLASHPPHSNPSHQRSRS